LPPLPHLPPTMKSRHLLQLSLFASALNNYAPVSAQGGGDVIADTICGPTDDRVLSFDLRQGRLKPIGCTAWLISEDVFLTAAHCGVPKERDDWRVHFTFGAEDAPLEDQYQVDYRTFGLGFVRNKGLDWIVGRLKGNEITEMLPGNAQSLKCGIPGCGWYSLGQVPSQASGNSIVITGYGGNSEQDDSFEPYSQRTSIGELVNITSTQLFYTTDSMVSKDG